MNTFQASVKQLLLTHTYSEKVVGLLNLIVKQGLDPLERDNYLSQIGVRRISDIKECTLDVIIDYAMFLLDDNVLTDDEMKSIRLLKMYLGVEDKDFIRNGKMEQVKQVLLSQLRFIYADNYVDPQEILQKGELQALFGVSYDDFEALVRIVAREALERGGDIQNLDTLL